MRVRSPQGPGLMEGFQEGHRAAEGMGCHTACVYRGQMCVQCVHSMGVQSVCAPTLFVYVDS